MTTQAEIRAATQADVAEVLAVDHFHAQRSGEVTAAVEQGLCLVAIRAGEILGFCVAGTFFGYDFLELLVVAPEQRRTGIATALVRTWERTARTEKLFTSTNRSNEPMQALCRSLGYEPSGRIEHLDDDDPELVFYRPNPTYLANGPSHRGSVSMDPRSS
jgi:ribosomal protein S18 acetylase RimI-like enzyme